MSRRRLIRILLLLLLLAIVAGLSAWFFPHQVLTLDSGEVKGDVIVVLGGGSHERPLRAAELFKAGAAPLIICSGEGDCRANKAILIKAGVPAEAILTECSSLNTKENAQFTVKLLRERKVERAIIVTTWYHSRRGIECFRHYAPEIKFHSRPSYYAYETKAWSKEGVAHYVRAEYLKLLGYWLRYGVCPL